ncbi:hypothetical protein FOL46_007590 [Perkinsus olseni]|uniref:Glucosylceramidase n=1 Tax=Perkinsus olseni TaxID=32597 RepID=A0A7J6LCT2_PEROL|nr:hypothetical protein FOL46_007590 [Perkinsus olseni]
MADNKANCQGKAASFTNEFGDDYAEHSAVFAKDADAEHMEMMGVPVRDVIMPAIEEALRDLGGKALKEAKILEIGCGTGSILDVLRLEGANPDFLYGVDLNEKSVAIAKANHNFHVQLVEGYDYVLPGNPVLDIVLCKQCLNHVPPADYDEFFDKIRRLHPKYFIFTALMSVYLLRHLFGCSSSSKNTTKAPENPTSSPGDMQVQGFTTTPTGKKWSPMVARVSGGAAGSPKVKVKTDAVDDWPIIGFGGSVPEMPGWTMGNLSLSEEQRQPFFDMYFGDDGARYNFLRLCIHTTFDDYTFADVPDDFNLDHFDYNVTGDRENYKFQTVKKVQEMVPDLTIIGSAWSPPSWMKLGDHSMDGSPNPCLKRDPRYHQVWAKYLVTWVDAYERLGVPIWAITQQNEPQ